MNELIPDIEIIGQDAENENDISHNHSALPHINNSKKLYIESYGCQMNFSDSEIVTSIMQKQGFGITETAEEADVIFINTCSSVLESVYYRFVLVNGYNYRYSGTL